MAHASRVASPHRTTPSSLVSVKLKVATEDDRRGISSVACMFQLFLPFPRTLHIRHLTLHRLLSSLKLMQLQHAATDAQMRKKVAPPPNQIKTRPKQIHNINI